MNQKYKLSLPSVWPRSNDKVRAIKSIRVLTGMGLKEALDLVNGADGDLMPEISVFDSGRPEMQDAIFDLRQEGVMVTPVDDHEVNEPNGMTASQAMMRAAAVASIEEGNINQAISILNLLL